MILLSACGRKEFTADMVKKVEAELPFELFSAPGSQALSAFDWLNQRYAGSASAVILGPNEELEYLGDRRFVPEFGTPESLLDKAGALEFPAGYRRHLRNQMSEMLQQFKDDPILQSLIESSGEIGLAEDMPTGDWPSELISPSDTQGLTLATSWETGRPYKEVLLGVFPSSDPTEIPAYLPFGGWNACPMPEWHVAALRYWREKWGARLIGISHDVLELRVEQRPKTRDAAIALAQEQYDYCADIVDQGVGDIATLAQYLMVSDWWYFWWD